MEEFDYIKNFDIQKKINFLAKNYKNKKIVLYGAGQYAQVIFQNYDLSKLNIIAVADKKFEQVGEHKFFNLRCVKPNDLKDLDYDVILISNFDYKMFANILDERILYGTKNAGVEIRPLIKLGFRDIFL